MSTTRTKVAIQATCTTVGAGLGLIAGYELSRFLDDCSCTYLVDHAASKNCTINPNADNTGFCFLTCPNDTDYNQLLANYRHYCDTHWRSSDYSFTVMGGMTGFCIGYLTGRLVVAYDVVPQSIDWLSRCFGLFRNNNAAEKQRLVRADDVEEPSIHIQSGDTEDIEMYQQRTM